MKVSGKITVKQDDSVAELLGILSGQRSMESIARFLLDGVRQGSQVLLGQIIRERFTGQGPFPVSQMRLGIVSARLRRSLNFSDPKFENNMITLSAGSNVSYFAKHEFGSNGLTFVRAARVMAHTVTNAFGRGKSVSVAAHVRRPHTRQENTPARMPLSAGIREHAGRIYGIAIERQLIRALESLEGGQA